MVMMKHKKRVTDGDRIATVHMKAQGVSNMDIAKVLDLGVATIYKILSSPEIREAVETARGIVGSGLNEAATNVRRRISWEGKKLERGERPVTSEAALRGMGVFVPEQQVQAAFVVTENIAALLREMGAPPALAAPAQLVGALPVAQAEAVSAPSPSCESESTSPSCTPTSETPSPAPVP